MLLALVACLAPWRPHGWFWLKLTVALTALAIGYDALDLWLDRKQLSLVLLPPEKGLRAREGERLRIPLALEGSLDGRRSKSVQLALMPATAEAQTAIRPVSQPQWLRLCAADRPESGRRTKETVQAVLLWLWTPEIALLRRGVWAGPRVGLEHRSRWGIWRLRQWFDLPLPVRIEPDLRAGRREILRSPVYRALVGARQTPWTGHGRDFERLREYQPGDIYSEIAWKSTARWDAPVTRLFQWEQKQEVYFLIDQSRASAQGVANGAPGESKAAKEPATASPRVLDVSVQTALIGATVALELGDQFGLVTFADGVTSWLRAGTGLFQFHQLRDRLLTLEPLATTPDYEELFGEIRLRLRRRAYLVLLAHLGERSVSDSLRRGVALIRTTHILLMTSLLPAHARPAFSSGDDPRTEEEVYRVLAGEKENQRLAALAQQMRQMDAQLRFVPVESFLRSAVEGFLQAKREQRL